jgi:hypothetical protein
MVQLQDAIARELGAAHTLKQSQLTAALGRDLTTRPGADLRGRVRRLREAVGLEAAAALLRSYPPLVLLASAREVRKRLDALAAAFGTPGRDGVLPLCSGPGGAARVLTLLAHTTAPRVQALCGVLRLERGGALALCAAHPALLMLDSATLRARADAIAARLGLEPERAAELCREHPSCLEAPSSTVLAAVEALREGLGVAGGAALQLCGARPSVFLLPAASAAEKAAALRRHLGLSPEMGGGALARCMVSAWRANSMVLEPGRARLLHGRCTGPRRAAEAQAWGMGGACSCTPWVATAIALCARVGTRGGAASIARCAAHQWWAVLCCAVLCCAVLCCGVL